MSESKNVERNGELVCEPYYFCEQCNMAVTEIIEVATTETIRMWDGDCYEWHTPLSSEVVSTKCSECGSILGWGEGY